MKSLDQILKIKATVLYILNQVPEGLDYIHLFKILYFAQQKHLVAYGMPLMEDTFCAKKLGPVPTLTYKVLRGVESGAKFESSYLNDFASSINVDLQNKHQIVTSVVSCDLDELSKSDIKVLNASISEYKEVASYALSDISHDKAWQKAKETAERTGEDTKIPMYDIAEAGGATKGMLSVIRERQWTVRNLS